MESKGLRMEEEQARAKLRETGRALVGSSALMGWAQGLIRFFLAAALAGGEVLGGASPFGLALVGASGAGSEGLAALLGAVLGYLLSRGLEEGLRYAACSILVFSVSFAFFDLAVYKRRFFMPLVATLLNAVTGLVTLTQGPWTAQGAAYFAGEMALTALGVYAFRWAFSLWAPSRREGEAGLRQRLGLLLLALAVLVSLAPVELLGLASVGRVLSALASLGAGWIAGPGAGAAVGLATGLAMDLSVAAPRVYAVSYALAALAAGLLKGRRRGAGAVGFALAGTAAVLWSRAGMVSLGAIYELILAAGVFLFLPQGWLDRAGLLFSPAQSADRVQWSYQAARQRLTQAADAFSQLFSTLRSAFDQTADNGEDPSVIFDRVANRVCVRCAMRERCWQRESQDTYDLLNAALTPMLESAQAQAEHFPQRFRDRCCRFPAFLSASEQELSAHLARRQYARRLRRSRLAICGQYEEMAQVLQDTAAAMAAPLRIDAARTRRLGRFLAGRELSCRGLVVQDPRGRLQLRLEGADAQALADDTARQALSSLMDLPLTAAATQGDQVLYRQREPLSALAGVAGKKRRGQSVSGDACAWFKDEVGLLYFLLCDGMGSGLLARQESELTVRLLEKFLLAGVQLPTALRTLDQALILRGEETGGFSTVDLLELDLYAGTGALYKLGAAPSYLKHGGGIRRLSGRSLPAGVGEADAPPPEPIRFQLGPGDCLVLLTDGVVDEDDQWLKEALSAFDGDSPADLAQALVDHEPEDQDDKTALVLRIGLRPEHDEPAEGKAEL